MEIQFQNRTKVIEIFGLPKTGKTTTIKALKKYLSKIGYKTEEVIERASKCPIKDKLHPFFNYWTTISFIKKYLEANEEGVHILLADRGILDAHLWINYFAQNNDFSNELEDFYKLTQIRLLSNIILKAYFFKSDIEIILKREFERQINRGSGRIMNKEVLSGYISAYEKTRDDLNSSFNIVEIDTTLLSIKEILAKVAEDAVKSIKENIKIL